MGRLTTVLDRVGGITKRPPIWAFVAAGLVGKGGAPGRDAALRGGVAYGIAAFLANVVIKPIVFRKRPPGSEKARFGPVTSSFPSGHAATDLAFVFGVSQRLPVLFLPLAGATFAAHWSLVRTRAHYVSDILAGGALGIAVAAAVGALWPEDDPGAGPSFNPHPDKDNEEERLITRIDGEEAQLLVHIERIDQVTPGTSSEAPVDASPRPDPTPLGE